MKKRTKSVLLNPVKIFLVIMFHLSCCQYIIKAQNNPLVLFGKVGNSRNDILILSNHYGTYTAITNNNGKYRFEEYIKNPDFLNLKIADNQITLFLLAGDTLELNFDLNDIINSIVFKGNREEMNTRLLTLSSGLPAPDFSLRDINGEIVNLSDFEGKYVYIDVWNSACKPCYKEFPEMEKLIEKYKDNNIVFIGISLDRNEETWKRTIIKKELKGIQLFGHGWKSKFAKDYFVEYNPRFILIDKNQKIVYLSAPRPSGGIDKFIDELEGI